MYKKCTLIICLLMNVSFLNAVIQYRQASLADVPSILKLINEKACQDSQKIVIFPTKFREPLLKDTIKKDRLFVAVDISGCCFFKQSRLVGYKKLFVVTDPNECTDILHNEIRAKKDAEQNTAYIYDGADYTDPDFRGQGVNSTLTNFALQSVTQNIVKTNPKQIALLYGLTKSNASSDIAGGRTKSILKSFQQFISTTKLAKKVPVDDVHIERYDAFMPTFDPNAVELQPLPDKNSVPGYGYVMSYKVKNIRGFYE